MLLFGKPQDINKSFIVNYAPLFAQLKNSEKRLILKKSDVVHYAKGAIIYKQDSPADAFYCMITGRVKIFRHTEQREETVDVLSCGKYFGIIPLLTTHTHYTSAQALNDSLILRIKKDDFSLILDKIPKLSLYLSKALPQQMGHWQYAKRASASHTICVYSAMKGIGRSMYAANLALSLGKETKKKVMLVELGATASHITDALQIAAKNRTMGFDVLLGKNDLEKFVMKDQELAVDFLNALHNPAAENAGVYVNSLFSLLADEYRYIIVDLPASVSEAISTIIAQSDEIHVITDYTIENLKFTKELMVNLFASVEYPQGKIKVILNERNPAAKIFPEEVIQALDHDIFASLPECAQATDTLTRASATVVLREPDSAYAKAIRRIARQTGEVMVGLALGGGAAFGLAHIGVIKALEKENIPVDIVAGSSMGALVAAFWASGKSAAEMETIMMEYNDRKDRVFCLMGDVCFPKSSLVAGKNVIKFLKKNLGDKTFHDVRMQLKILATNLDTRKVMVYDSGSLVEAVKASIAIPGFFKPVSSKGGLVIDGGILAPVPTDILAEAGVKKIIAVNVLPSPRDVEEGFKQYQYRFAQEKAEIQKRGLAARVFYSGRLLLQKLFFPNIMDLMINSLQTMEYEMSLENCRKADVVINPIIAGLHWFEFFRARAFIDKGEQETQKAMAKIKELINS